MAPAVPNVPGGLSSTAYPYDDSVTLLGDDDASDGVHIDMFAFGPPPPLNMADVESLESSFKNWDALSVGGGGGSGGDLRRTSEAEGSGSSALNADGALPPPRPRGPRTADASNPHAETRSKLAQELDAEAAEGGELDNGELADPEDEVAYAGDHAELLHCAATKDFEEMRMLLEEGADARACADPQGESKAIATETTKGGDADDVPLGSCGPSRIMHDVVRAGYDPACISLLLKHGGATVLVDRDEGGATPLHIAAHHGRAHSARALLFDASANGKQGARTCLLMLRDAYGDTPLHIAAAKGRADVLEACLDAAACARAGGAGPSDAGMAAAAAAHDGLEMRDILPSRLADVLNARDLDRNTPLHRAAASGAEAVIAKLLACRVCNLEAANAAGWTPADIAATDAVRELLS